MYAIRSYYVRAEGKSIRIGRAGCAEETHVADDPMDALAGILGERKYRAVAELPRFSGGAVGFIGYDYVRHLERIPDLHPGDGTPDALFLFPSRLVIFDNVKHRILIVAHGRMRPGETGEETYNRCLRSIAEVRDVLREPLPWTEVPDTDEAIRSRFEMSRERFTAAVRRTKRNNFV